MRKGTRLSPAPYLTVVVVVQGESLGTRLIEGSYYDSWPLLDFFKMWDVPVFHSAGHINFVVRLLLALHPGKP